MVEFWAVYFLMLVYISTCIKCVGYSNEFIHDAVSNITCIFRHGYQFSRKRNRYELAWFSEENCEVNSSYCVFVCYCCCSVVCCFERVDFWSIYWLGINYITTRQDLLLGNGGSYNWRCTKCRKRYLKCTQLVILAIYCKPYYILRLSLAFVYILGICCWYGRSRDMGCCAFHSIANWICIFAFN